MHSFDQHIQIKDENNIYILELSEGMYCSQLSRLVHPDDSCYDDREYISVFDYANRRNSDFAVSTYATADDLALSDHTILSVGQSIDQSTDLSKIEDMDYRSVPYNIYLSITDMNNFSKNSRYHRYGY